MNSSSEKIDQIQKLINKLNWSLWRYMQVLLTIPRIPRTLHSFLCTSSNPSAGFTQILDICTHLISAQWKEEPTVLLYLQAWSRWELQMAIQGQTLSCSTLRKCLCFDYDGWGEGEGVREKGNRGVVRVLIFWHCGLVRNCKKPLSSFTLGECLCFTSMEGRGIGEWWECSHLLTLWPWFQSWTWLYNWVEFVVDLSSHREFSLGSPHISSKPKTNNEF